jgi:hypothetical protein
MRYTYDYFSQYQAGKHGDEDSSEFYTAQFQREAQQYLQGSAADDVGGVILYHREGEEIAFFDYENLVGSIYELGGKRSDEF